MHEEMGWGGHPQFGALLSFVLQAMAFVFEHIELIRERAVLSSVYERMLGYTCHAVFEPRTGGDEGIFH